MSTIDKTQHNTREELASELGWSTGKVAMRIRSRAIRRAGELLKQFDGRGRPSKNTNGTDGNLSQRQVAQQAGLSERQQLQASRIANVDEGELYLMFETELLLRSKKEV